MARYHSGSGAGDDLAAGIVVVILMLLAAAAIAVVTLVVATLVELGKVYRRHARAGSPIARWLWLALAGLAGIWLIAALLATAGLTAPAAYLVAWSFLVYVLTVELLAHTQGPPEPAPPPDLHLAQVLEPWHTTVPSAVGQPAYEKLAA